MSVLAYAALLWLGLLVVALIGLLRLEEDTGENETAMESYRRYDSPCA